jgi:hypothetical protein
MDMIRWTDLIGVAGFAMVVFSPLLLFPHSAEGANWKDWIAGLALWFMGFAFLLGWLVLRWSVRHSKEGPPPLLVWSVRHSRGREASAMNAGHLQNKRAGKA